MPDNQSDPNYQDILDKYADSIKSTDLPPTLQPEADLNPKQEPEPLLDTELTSESKLKINPQPDNEVSFNLETDSKTELTDPLQPEMETIDSLSVPEIQPILETPPEPLNLTTPPAPEAITTPEVPEELPSDVPDIAPPKENHFFKYLFFFSLIVFLVVIVFIVLSFINSQKSLSNSSTTPTTKPPTAAPSQFCELNGENYTIGQSFTATDGCNTCSCGEDLQIACTSMACEVTSTTSTIPKDWKTYTDKTYKFSFSYPSTYTLITRDSTNEGMPIVFLNSKMFTVPEVWGNGQAAPIQFFVSTKTIESYIDSYKKLFDPNTFVQSKLVLPLIGYRLEGVIKIQVSEAGPLDGTKLTKAIIQIPDSQKILEISYDFNRQVLTEAIFDQILSTFRFL